MQIFGPRVTNQWNCLRHDPKLNFRAASVQIGHDLLFVGPRICVTIGCVTNIWSKNYTPSKELVPEPLVIIARGCAIQGTYASNMHSEGLSDRQKL